jgi:hypothetical protein
VARRSSLPALRYDRERNPFQGKNDATWFVELSRVPQTIHGENQNGIRIEPRSTAYLAPDDLSVLLFEKGLRYAATSAHFRLQYENRMVPRDARS